MGVLSCRKIWKPPCLGLEQTQALLKTRLPICQNFQTTNPQGLGSLVGSSEVRHERRDWLILAIHDDLALRGRSFGMAML